MLFPKGTITSAHRILCVSPATLLSLYQPAALPRAARRRHSAHNDVQDPVDLSPKKREVKMLKQPFILYVAQFSFPGNVNIHRGIGGAELAVILGWVTVVNSNCLCSCSNRQNPRPVQLCIKYTKYGHPHGSYPNIWGQTRHTVCACECTYRVCKILSRSNSVDCLHTKPVKTRKSIFYRLKTTSSHSVILDSELDNVHAQMVRAPLCLLKRYC